MITAIILMEEKRFSPNTYECFHYYKKEEGGLIPEAASYIEKTLPDTIKVMEKDGYKRLEVMLTMEEIILLGVAKIVIKFFDIDGKFKKFHVYNQVA